MAQIDTILVPVRLPAEFVTSEDVVYPINTRYVLPFHLGCWSIFIVSLVAVINDFDPVLAN